FIFGKEFSDYKDFLNSSLDSTVNPCKDFSSYIRPGCELQDVKDSFAYRLPNVNNLVERKTALDKTAAFFFGCNFTLHSPLIVKEELRQVKVFWNEVFELVTSRVAAKNDSVIELITFLAAKFDIGV